MKVVAPPPRTKFSFFANLPPVIKSFVLQVRWPEGVTYKKVRLMPPWKNNLMQN